MYLPRRKTFPLQHNTITATSLISLVTMAATISFTYYLSIGDGDFVINFCARSLPDGVMYGAAAGSMDRRFRSFDIQLDSVILKANDTLNETLFAC
jgi:tannase